jgi:hypothetical protein
MKNCEQISGFTSNFGNKEGPKEIGDAHWVNRRFSSTNIQIVLEILTISLSLFGLIIFLQVTAQHAQAQVSSDFGAGGSPGQLGPSDQGGGLGSPGQLGPSDQGGGLGSPGQLGPSDQGGGLGQSPSQQYSVYPNDNLGFKLEVPSDSRIYKETPNYAILSIPGGALGISLVTNLNGQSLKDFAQTQFSKTQQSSSDVRIAKVKSGTLSGYPSTVVIYGTTSESGNREVGMKDYTVTGDRGYMLEFLISGRAVNCCLDAVLSNINHITSSFEITGQEQSPSSEQPQNIPSPEQSPSSEQPQNIPPPF